MEFTYTKESYPTTITEEIREQVARISNIHLRHHLDLCPVVYGEYEKGKMSFFGADKNESAKHQAYLFNLQEIEKKKVTVTGDQLDLALSCASKETGILISGTFIREVRERMGF